MGRLTATMVVDLEDRTGRKAQAIIGNLDRLKRAERDYALAQSGTRLTGKDRAMERLMIERERDMERRRAKIALWAGTAATGTIAAGIAAGAAYKNFADVERRINRIVINADKGAGAIGPTIQQLQKIANDARMGFDATAEGFETLVASGRSLEESMAFLPSVAKTAQASGAAMNDIALSADALAGSMNIDPSNMQRAFDILVAGGKAGKFELKDMSQYLPSLLPAFAALGYKGTDGLQKIVAMLQVIRNQAGTSGEAATYMGNVLNKMYSEETSKKFAKMGVDLPKALDKAKKEGKDLFDVFLDLTRIATKGDLAKLPLLFQDAEMQKGVRALLTQRDALRSLTQSLGNVDGTALQDFNQIAGDSAAKIQRLSNLWDKFVTQAGSGVATVVNPALETVTDGIDDVMARARATAGMDEEQRNWQRQDFAKAYKEANPDAWFWEVNNAYAKALEKVGRGQAKTVLDDLNLDKARKAGGEITARYPSRGSYGADAQASMEGRSEFPGGDRHIDPRKLPKTGVPTPMGRPGDADSQDLRDRQMHAQYAYPSPGTYEPGVMEAEVERRDREIKLRAAGAYPDPQNDPTPAEDATFMQGLKRFLLGAAADPNFNAREHFGIETKAAESGPKSVSIEGTPTVTITNPPPRPNVTVQVTMPVQIQQAPDPMGAANALSQAVKSELNRVQASTQDAGY